ncbi:MAG: hypothetical protein CMP30_08350 [Roseibacillus sp.]|nr:hypothetical protein [Roseibacillus sp.]
MILPTIHKTASEPRPLGEKITFYYSLPAKDLCNPETRIGNSRLLNYCIWKHSILLQLLPLFASRTQGA